ncbi:hypothetical protein QBC42DRAFT_39127 [Cladorrhinum samala]|uniref:Pathway-specific nitrogen regulator n=1 Tax=Cladorrhinum samala TaxID=585594 RepID=A0AAV9HWW1_9PEZI|nr:hypothetical protein QBC42DRAFT_39127 [Cladorrhinum samala]
MAQDPSIFNPGSTLDKYPAAEVQPPQLKDPATNNAIPEETSSSQSGMFQDDGDFGAAARHQVHSRNSSEDTVHHDDDVFSDNGHRSGSSLGSTQEDHDGSTQTPREKDDASRRESIDSSQNSERIMSGVSGISGFTQYEMEPHFVATVRENRKPFRTPSEIRAMQMSSPTESVFNGSSPRPNKRSTPNPTSPFPTISRVGSPSAQYSPKGRTTPTRFKSKKEAPLVLLHVTLLPLRWVWGDVLGGLDAVNGKALDENGLPFIASEQLKTLRDSWRELQDRVTENVLERGVLVPHPQNDFEVLEERLLESLELPVRRRARILECGHYLGPANMPSDFDEESDDDSSASEEMEDKRHWCNECKSEIRYEHLGSKKVYRVKVYASNGLMKAGAWDACWNDMERVDVEVEPIVDSTLHTELEKLAVVELEYEDQRQKEAVPEVIREAETPAQRGPTPDPDRFSNRSKSRQSDRGTPAPDFRFMGNLHDDQARGVSSRPGSAVNRPASRSGSVMETRMHPSSPSRMNTPDRLHPPEILSPRRPRAQSRLQVEVIDEVEERRLREEERMREIYGDAPPAGPDDNYTAAVETDSQALAIVAPESSDPQVPPFAEDLHEEPPNPTTHRRFHHQNPSFVDLLTEAFRVALDNGLNTSRDLTVTLKSFLGDPKNVAIVVLTLLVVVIGLGGRGKQDMAPAVYRHEPRAGDNPALPTQVPVIESASQINVDAPAKQPVENPVLRAMEPASLNEQSAAVVYSAMSGSSQPEAVSVPEAQSVLMSGLETVPRVPVGVSSPVLESTANKIPEIDAPAVVEAAVAGELLDGQEIEALSAGEVVGTDMAA